MTWRGAWLTFLVLAGLLGGCVVRARPVEYVGVDYQETYVANPPPAPVVEYRPMAPAGYGSTWVDGYWDWSGYDWYWVNGYWAPSRPGYAYVRPRVVHSNGRWLYHRGYWNGDDGNRDYHYARPAPAGAYGGGPSWRNSPAPAGPQQGWRAAPPYAGAPGAPRSAPPAQGWQGAPAHTQAAPPAPSYGQPAPVRGNPSPVTVTPTSPASPPGWKPLPPPPAPVPVPPTQQGATTGYQRRMPTYAPPQDPNGKPGRPLQIAPARGPQRAPSSVLQGPSRAPPQPVQSGGDRRPAPARRGQAPPPQ